MYIDSRPFSIFDPFQFSIFIRMYVCVCVCLYVCMCVYVYMCICVYYSCVHMFIYVYYVYHYKYECMRVYACGQMCSMYTTFRNKLLARSSIFFFSRAFFFSCVFSRVTASRLEKLNIPCIHIYACLYICVCIQLKGTRC